MIEMLDYSDRLAAHARAGKNPWDLLAPEQRQALEAYRSDKGRLWKSRLTEAWITGRYHWDGNLNHLQRIRNTWGPHLLQKL